MNNSTNSSPIRDNVDALARTLVLAVTARTDAQAAEAIDIAAAFEDCMSAEDVTTAMALADAELAMLGGAA